jgi:hypothetical protein
MPFDEAFFWVRSHGSYERNDVIIIGCVKEQ